MWFALCVRAEARTHMRSYVGSEFCDRNWLGFSREQAFVDFLLDEYIDEVSIETSGALLLAQDFQRPFH